MCRKNFFGLLKTKFFYDRKFESITEFKVELINYKNYYNNECVKLRLKEKSQIQYKMDFEQVA